MDQRAALVSLVASGVSISEAARRFGVSRPTVYKWLARYDTEGLEGLGDRSRRPETSPKRTSLEITELVCSTRRKFPTWGGRKIRHYLVRRDHSGVPAASTITQILKRNGLVEPVETEPKATLRFEAAAPNDMWQIDFKGHFALGNGERCHPLGVMDDHSRFNVCLGACDNERTATVAAQLTTTFHTYGLPIEFLADNGPPWGSTNAVFRWTPLKVWLADLGIGVIHSRPRHPQTLGKEERFHRTLRQDVLDRRTITNITAATAAFDTFRHVYNELRPHEALDYDVPADRYQPSPRIFPTRIEPPHYPDHYTVRTVDAAARITNQGTRHKIGKPFIGRRVGIDPQTLIIYYRTYPIRHVNHLPEHP